MGMLADMSVWAIAASLFVVLSAGFVKGAVGFAMPMILISGIGSFMPAEVAIAGLILPTLATNLIQSLRQGVGTALGSLRRYWRFCLVLFVMILVMAQMVSYMDQRLLFTLLGVPIIGFSILQLRGWQLRIPPGREAAVEVAIATVSGFFGGLTGVWGPPTILYLTARGVDKVEHVRVQGVIYLFGAIILTLAHLKSGVLNTATAPYSALLVVPALLGQVIGFRFHDSMDQALFRKLTLLALLVAGANLVRRGVF